MVFSLPPNLGLEAHSLGCAAVSGWGQLGDRISIFCLEGAGRKMRTVVLLWARLQEAKRIDTRGHSCWGGHLRENSQSQPRPLPSHRNPLELPRWIMSVTLALGELGYENYKEFKASLGSRVSPRTLRGTA